MQATTIRTALNEKEMDLFLSQSRLAYSRFEFEEDGSSKYWEIGTNGHEVTTRWGRIGTYGRSQTREYPNEAAAAKAAEMQVAEKEHKGYEPVDESELGDEISEVLDRLGMWTHPGRVPLGNGKDDFDDEWGQPGSQYWYVDGEDMAEGDMESVHEEMAPSLKRVGLELSVATLMGPYGENSTGYDISINGIAVEMYRTEPSNPKLPLCDDPWMDCSVKPLAVVNQLLKESGSVYRIGLMYPGGNDGMAILLPYDILYRLSLMEFMLEAEFVLP
jgi:predicted DNA-binding WGR domain protein